jgi:hypothetical protein
VAVAVVRHVSSPDLRVPAPRCAHPRLRSRSART